MRKTAKKIRLGRETVKVLGAVALDGARGGWWTKGYGDCSTVQMTKCPCEAGESDYYNTCATCNTLFC